MICNHFVLFWLDLLLDWNWMGVVEYLVRVVNFGECFWRAGEAYFSFSISTVLVFFLVFLVCYISLGKGTISGWSVVMYVPKHLCESAKSHT